MIAVALKGLAGRKVRALLTALAVLVIVWYFWALLLLWWWCLGSRALDSRRSEVETGFR